MASNDPHRSRTVGSSMERPTRIFSKQTKDVNNNNSPSSEKER